MVFNQVITKILFISFSTIGLIFASALFSDAIAETKSPVLEIVSFKAKPNASTQEIIDKSKAITEDLKKFDGFIKRTITQDTKESTQWVDIIEWRSIEDSKKAMDATIDKPDMQDFLNLMKHGSKSYKKKPSYLDIKATS